MKRIIFILTTIVILMISGTTIISAFQHNGYCLTGGVGNYGSNKRYYYIDSSCTGSLPSYIGTAWYEWTYTAITTPISVKETQTKSQSSFDFYYENIYPASYGIYGKTYFYNGNVQAVLNDYVQMPIENWSWTQIKLNSSSFYSLPTNTNGINKQKGVVAHEIGHAMGLWHVTDDACLMNIGGSDSVDKCTSDELNGINDLY